ncbi:MAG: NAD(P)/FAD-dependent oxidoreductase [Proteobacteria bacterium]|nr:NAD(P)/FAD-dependent oxidoreductase [Pseudomonadota bacterium]
MDEVDVLVIGAGVVGLACARALALQGRAVVIVEAAGQFGSGTSSRNSEVVHAGLYYEPGSLKARLCVRGREMLYDYCAARGVAAQRCGKLLVATRAADVAQLEPIRRRAAACGVHDLQPLDGAALRALEPELQAVAALWSPSSGIVDSHGLMAALLGDAEQAGALFAVASPFAGARREGGRWIVRTGNHNDSEPFELAARWLVNSAGLQAQAVAARMQGFAAAAIPRRHLAKGHYFGFSGRAPFRHLIYPMPVDGGLGVHLTLDLGGQARFGPDVEWLPDTTDDDDAALDYAVDPARLPAFEAEIRRYWPALPAGSLQPAYSGIRPKLSGPGAPAADFHIAGPAQHGAAGVVQLFGIESPGLTASLAIGEQVAEIVAAAEG